MEHDERSGAWARPQEDRGPAGWDVVVPSSLAPPSAPPPVAGGPPPTAPTRHARIVLGAVGVCALALGVLGGAALGVRAADDQDRVDALSVEVAQLEDEVSGLEDETSGLEGELSGTRAQAADDVAAARGEAEAAVAAENAATGAELDARAAELTAREGALAAREDAVRVLEQQAADGSIPGSGSHLVGEEIAPGTYRASSPEDCYWERLSGLSGEFGDIITNGLGAGDSTVTIRGSDVAFASERCGTWSRIG